MKIAIVDQPLGTIILPWTGRGGSLDIWIHEVARRLAQSCDVIVYSRKDRHQKKVEYDQGVEYRRVSTTFGKWFKVIRKLERIPRFRDLTRVLFYRNTRRPFFASRLSYLTYALQVANDLRKQGCDIVHILNFSQFARVIRVFNPKVKIVLNTRCEWLTQLDRKMIERRLRDVDLIIGCSQYITEKVRRFFPQFAKRCQASYPGVDVDRFVQANEHNTLKRDGIKRLLFVGRVSPEKGLHVLLDAFRKVIDRYAEARLEIVGSKSQLPVEFLVGLSDDGAVSKLASFYDGNSRQSYFYHLQRQILSLGIANNVTFTDYVPYEEVVNYYRNADVVVNPSLSESFGRSLIEAMACSVPVVATRVGGMTEIVEEGKTGLLVEPGDAQALAYAMLRLLSDEDLRKTMGKAARERAVELFSWEKIVENLLSTYTSICECHD